ncbi:MAG: hypothetical protein ACHQ52_04190 [Candidatus Eisenbacteria bacterium]
MAPVPKALCQACGRPVANFRSPKCVYCGAPVALGARLEAAPAAQTALTPEMLLALETGPRSAGDQKRLRIVLRVVAITISVMVIGIVIALARHASLQGTAGGPGSAAVGDVRKP